MQWAKWAPWRLRVIGFISPSNIGASVAYREVAQPLAGGQRSATTGEQPVNHMIRDAGEVTHRSGGGAALTSG